MLHRLALALLLTAALSCRAFPTLAQTAPSAATPVLREQHCLIVLFGMTAFSTKGKMSMEYGLGTGLSSEQLARTEAEAARVREIKHIIDVLNYMSSQGWIFSGLQGAHYFFRRPLN